jgi:hypothetical protein
MVKYIINKLKQIQLLKIIKTSFQKLSIIKAIKRSITWPS